MAAPTTYLNTPRVSQWSWLHDPTLSRCTSCNADHLPGLQCYYGDKPCDLGQSYGETRIDVEHERVMQLELRDMLVRKIVALRAEAVEGRVGAVGKKGGGKAIGKKKEAKNKNKRSNAVKKPASVTMVAA